MPRSVGNDTALANPGSPEDGELSRDGVAVGGDSGATIGAGGREGCGAGDVGVVCVREGIPAARDTSPELTAARGFCGSVRGGAIGTDVVDVVRAAGGVTAGATALSRESVDAATAALSAGGVGTANFGSITLGGVPFATGTSTPPLSANVVVA